MWEDTPYLPASHHQSQHRSLEHNYEPGERSPSATPSEDSGDFRKLRWARSNFSQDEIQALESPLQQEISPTSLYQVVSEDPYNNPHSQSRDTPVFLTNKGSRRNEGNEDPLNPTVSYEEGFIERNNFQKAARVTLLILPAIFFAAAAHFINGIMTDFKLFSASFSVFQGVFWPSFIFLVIDLIWWRKPVEGDERSCAGLSCSDGRWKLILLLLFHGTLAGIAMIMQLLSIQRLNISVSLALSFAPEVYVILLTFINREKKFSPELILCSVLTYIGFITVGIPAMTSGSFRMAEGLTAGLVASLGSMTLAVPASFTLCHLRKNRVPDSLIAVSFAFHGSLFSWITKVIMGSTMDLTFDPISVSWAAGLIGLVLCGTLLLFLESRFRTVHSDRGASRTLNATSRISQMRMLIFIFSCFWEILRQGMWHTFPGIYDIFGSIFVVLGYLLSVGFEAWTLSVSNEVKEESSPFQFISWLCSRTSVGNGSG